MFVDFNILNQLGSPSINSNTFANRPAAGQTGRLFVSTDTYEIYRDNGTTWDLIGGPGSSTVTGTGAATQVAYWTAAQAIGGSNNLWWDNTNGFLGVGTAAPTTRIEAVKTDGIGIYANFTTNAGSGSGTTGIYSINNTASSGYAAVIEERTGNTTGGQYPLLVKHSLSAGTAAIGMGTGLQFQLPDDAGTFKTTQLTIETIDAAAATYKTRYRFNVQNNGSSTPVAYINSTGVGVFTATPSSALDIHSTGIMVQLNSTSATANSLLAFQRSGSGLWRIGDAYNGGSNYFELHNTVLGSNAMQVFAATNKTSWQATETYTTGLARGNYFDYNLSVAAGGSFSSPNAITALGASLDLTLAGNATIPSGARSGLDAYNSISFTGTGTLTHNQGTQIRAYSNVTAGWAFGGSATGTITHLAGLRALFPDNSGSAVTITNNYALLLNDQTANTGTVTYTNRWGIYQEGTSDLNYMAANLLLGSTVNNGDKLQVNGAVSLSGNLTVDTNVLFVDSSNNRVGIGTTTLTNKLTVIDSQTGTQITTNPVGKFVNTGNAFSKFILGSDNANYDAVASMDNNATLANCKLRFYIGNGTGSTAGHSNDQFVITGNNNIGISTVSPADLLDITRSSNSNSTGGLTLTNTDNSGYGSSVSWNLKLNSVAGVWGRIAVEAATSSSTYMPFFTTIGSALGERMRINSSGNLVFPSGAVVGLQTADGSDNGYLAISGADADGSTRGGLIYLSGNERSVDAGSLVLSSGDTTTGTGATACIVFRPKGSESARFTAGGNFLIGTTTDVGQKLQVSGSLLVTTNSYQGAAVMSSSFTAQRVVGSTTAGASGVAKKIIFCSYSATINVKVFAYQSGTSSATISQDFAIAYGASAAGAATSTVVNNVTAISLAYNNGGSPTYTIDCTVSYTGAAPTLYIIVDGIAFADMSIL